MSKKNYTFSVLDTAGYDAPSSVYTNKVIGALDRRGVRLTAYETSDLIHTVLDEERAYTAPANDCYTLDAAPAYDYMGRDKIEFNVVTF